MNEKFLELLHKIVKDEKLLDEIVKIESFDKLYDIIINIQSDLNISKKELKDFVEKYAEELNENQLSEIAGGVKDLKSKIMPSVAASMLSLLIMGQMGASAVGNERMSSEPVSAVNSKQEEQEQGFISRNIGKLTAGAAFLTAAGVYMFFPRSAPAKPVPAKPVPAKPVPVKPSKGSEEIIAQLPGAWKEFLTVTHMNFHRIPSSTFRDNSIPPSRLDVLRSPAQEAATNAAINAAGSTPGPIGSYWLVWDAARHADEVREAKRSGLQRQLGHFVPYNYNVELDDIWDAAFVSSWSRDGNVYKLIENKEKGYFVNLLKVLREQTEKLRREAAHS